MKKPKIHHLTLLIANHATATTTMKNKFRGGEKGKEATAPICGLGKRIGLYIYSGSPQTLAGGCYLVWSFTDKIYPRVQFLLEQTCYLF